MVTVVVYVIPIEKNVTALPTCTLVNNTYHRGREAFRAGDAVERALTRQNVALGTGCRYKQPKQPKQRCQGTQPATTPLAIAPCGRALILADE